MGLEKEHSCEPGPGVHLLAKKIIFIFLDFFGGMQAANTLSSVFPPPYKFVRYSYITKLCLESQVTLK